MRKIFVLRQSQSLNHKDEWIINGFLIFGERKANIQIKTYGVNKYMAFCELADYLKMYDMDPEGIIADRRSSFGRRGRDARRSGDPSIP